MKQNTNCTVSLLVLNISS